MKISTNKIKSNSSKFNYHYWNYSSDKLNNSIKYSGINNPIVLLQNQKELIPIHGFRRLEIAKKLNISDIPVKIFTDENNLENLFMESVIENTINNELNIYEKCKIIQILNNYLPDYNKNYWQKTLEIPLNEKNEKIINSILQFPKEWIEFFIEKNVPLKRIKTFTKIDNLELLTKLLPLNISLNRMEQMFQFLFEISQRDEITVKSILDIVNFEPILMDSTIEKQDTIKILYDRIYNLRYPLQSKYLEIVEKKVKELKINNNIKIQYDKTFERSGINFILNIKNKNDLQKSIEWLKNNTNKITNITKK